MARIVCTVALTTAALIVMACGSNSQNATTTPAPVVAPSASADCPTAADLGFVCGLKAPEDLVRIAASRWLVASGMQPGAGLSFIDAEAKAARTTTWATRPDQTRFSGCPGPLDPSLAILHGLSLRTRASGGYTLYATNHGGRESVEVFELDAAEPPAITWVGCVVLPEGLSANSVAAFSDGTLVATVLMLPGTAFEEVFARRNTGIVIQWTPGSAAFERLSGTELSGNNGIETSADDREFYVAASGNQRIVAFARADPRRPLRSAQLNGFAPDNVRLVDGRLIAAGMLDDEPACGGAPRKPEDIQCPRGWIAVAVDPMSMTTTEVARGPRAEAYGGTATAIPIGNTLWLSSFNADRVAFAALPPQ